jgi:ubiquinone/menaquinone biosynthesis C-methylase UbiE/glycosyltransferase involved in cell wall biosynthesis
MSRAMLNIITRDTKKETVMDSYKEYPDTTPKGLTEFHASTIDPMFCEIPEGSRVLDVGCNSGDFLKMLKDHKECSVIGIDVSENVLALAKDKGLEVLKADAEALPFEDASFDVVVLREVLMHLHDPVKALREIKRVLKPSGFLLGSAPHANLESKVWEEQHLHHRYYTEERLMGQLNEVFDQTHLRVLNGAQFSVSMASSLMGDKPAELLWKSGHADVPAWEYALTSDKKTLRVWMGPTQPAGDAYYRMIGFAAKMRGMKNTEIGFENFNWTDDSCSSWQHKLLMNEEGDVVSSLSLHHLEKCLKVADPWIFQLTYFEDIICLLESLKEMNPTKKLITECDDLVFDVPAYNAASHPYKPNSEKERLADEQFRLSDAFIVSTNFLKEKLGEMYPDKPIHVIPNAIDFSLWDNTKGDGKMEPKKEGVVRMIYTGCANHGGDMEIVKPVILALLDEFPNLEFIIAQDLGTFKDVKHERLKVLDRWVSIVDYPAMVKGWDADIGLAPLRDHNFNRAKSNLRWLEYSALRIPTVASPIRPFNESIKNGATGYLCSTKQEWYGVLKGLIKNPVNRAQVGANAYLTVREHFNMDKVAEQYRAVLEEIKRGPVSPIR